MSIVSCDAADCIHCSGRRLRTVRHKDGTPSYGCKLDIVSLYLETVCAEGSDFEVRGDGKEIPIPRSDSVFAACRHYEPRDPYESMEDGQ
jgi:hypothetical protein